MHTETIKALDVLSKDLNLPKETILDESLKVFLEKKLREIKTAIFKIAVKYNVSSVKEFEDLYKKGKVEEKDTWEDLQKLDHLEFKRDEIEKLIEGLK
jgi:intein-encoded DNA endonuclease-like protein